MKTGSRGGSPFVWNDILRSCQGRLPATVAAPTATAIATVPTATAASPATATTAATSASAASATTITATSAATRSTSTAASATFARGPSFVDDNVATHEIVPVQTLNGALGFLVAVNLDKPEPAWLPRKTVAHQSDICRGDSRLCK
jgi:hypothetical protein